MESGVAEQSGECEWNRARAKYINTQTITHAIVLLAFGMPCGR